MSRVTLAQEICTSTQAYPTCQCKEPKPKCPKTKKKKNIQETREAQELAAVEGLQRLAAMQEEMKKAEVQSTTKKSKAVRPHTRPVKKKSTPAPQADKKLLGAGAAGEDGIVEDKDGGHQKDDRIKTKKKTEKDVIKAAPQVLVGDFGDKLICSEECLNTIPKASAVKITNVATELTEDGSLPMGAIKDNAEIDAPTDADDDVPTDADDNAPTGADDNAPTDADDNAEDDARMDVEDDGAYKTQDISDGLSSLTFCCSKNQKHNTVDTKHPAPASKDSSDKDDDIGALNVDPRLTKPTGSKTAKKAVHLTSSTSIGISKPSTTLQPPAKKIKIEDGANDTDQQWSKHFLPTLYLWAGSQDDLWQISDASLIEALQCIMDVVYDDSDLQYKATQRLAEWRSNFGSTGLAIMIDFFARNKDTDVKVLGKALLDNFAFIFEDMDNMDPMQAFRSPFMLQLFTTAHLHSIIWHTHITALKTDVLASIGMAGVLGICAASLKCAIKCLSDGAIDIDSDALDMHPTQRKRKLWMPKTFNEATGNHSITEHAFSINNWGIKKKGDIFLRDTSLMARKLLKKSGSASLQKYLHLNDEEESDVDKHNHNFMLLQVFKSCCLHLFVPSHFAHYSAIPL
ncbi:uncharacterized protein EDB91DRAFT_1087979 [Suillus paluster]|uniref:uncharacterized protein n=1 Tax=Suillus paluster TaxID=48578 RepID=UPI001B85E744|nr:uncharacterized protein EDB91DRAFT_1087979 [Suillus paluster]KAG1722876.1 hypothetical protein EDB91DRAFT_1087979 [Suillus paluster]